MVRLGGRGRETSYDAPMNPLLLVLVEDEEGVGAVVILFEVELIVLYE